MRKNDKCKILHLEKIVNTVIFLWVVSRDWGELLMIPVDSSEVFTIAGSYFYYFLTTFSCLNLKKEDIGVRHFAIT